MEVPIKNNLSLSLSLSRSRSRSLSLAPRPRRTLRFPSVAQGEVIEFVNKAHRAIAVCSIRNGGVRVKELQMGGACVLRGASASVPARAECTRKTESRKRVKGHVSGLKLDRGGQGGEWGEGEGVT